MIKNKTSKMLGDEGENAAYLYLKKHNLKLITRNYCCRFGEIDLIMKNKKVIVFVEVRRRNSTQYGHPFETINYAKQKKIILTAQRYLQESKMHENHPCRFDIVGVTLHAGQYQIEWCQNAFREDESS